MTTRTATPDHPLACIEAILERIQALEKRVAELGAREGGR